MEQQIRILCVDDERNVLRALERVFLEEDYEIFTAMSGQEGIETLKSVSPVEIVVSDYRMPEMNGVDFLREVYENWPDTIRIVLSGYADTASIVGAINEGHIYKFIPKPWNDDELKVTIANAVERYQLLMRNKELTESLKNANKELNIINQNLETLVEERTKDLIFQNQALIKSQNILDALPVAVVGMGPDGMIVQHNLEAIEVIDTSGAGILGHNRKNVFSEEINAFIEDVIKKGAFSKKVVMNGAQMNIKGRFMKHHDGQEGIILVLCREGIDV